MAAVDLKGVTKRYADTIAVNAVDLHVAEGALVCLLGPSGCGKTTILRLIAGFTALDRGEIRVGERLISAPGQTLGPELRGMSMVFQSYALWPHMNVAQNVGYGLKLRKTANATLNRKLKTPHGVSIRFSPRQSSPLSPHVIPRNSPAVSSSAWLWRVHWSSSRKSCCSTSRYRISTLTCAKKCALRSGGFTMSSATRPSTSRMIRRKR